MSKIIKNINPGISDHTIELLDAICKPDKIFSKNFNLYHLLHITWAKFQLFVGYYSIPVSMLICMHESKMKHLTLKTT